MKSRYASVLIVLGLVACGDSADTPGPTPSEPGDAAAPSSTPMRPDASPEDLAAIRAREDLRSARALAEVERRFASRTPGLSFRVRRVRTSSMGDTHVWIQQVFQGTPVTGRELGVIVFVDDTLQVLGEPDTFEGVAPARMKATEGLKRARAHVAKKGLTVGDTGDVVLEPVYERRLRPGASGGNAANYETVVVGFERGTRVKVSSVLSADAPRELFVRERDGAVVERAFPPSVMAKGSLRSAFAGTVTMGTYQSSRGVYSLESERGDVISAAAQKDGSPAFDYKSSVNGWGDNQLYASQGPNTVNGQTAAADAFISVYGTHRMFADVYGRNGWDGQGGPIHAYVHYPEANAHPMGNGVVVLGYISIKGGLSSVPLTDIESVAHEVGHMTFELDTGVVTGPTGELGGLDEGTADIFGLVAGFYLPDAIALLGTSCTPLTCSSGGGRKPITVRGDWTFGNWGDPRYGRSFIDPFLYPAWVPGIDSAASHDASGPLRRMFYFLSVGVLPAGQAPVAGLLQPQRESAFLPQGLTGLGITTANWLWYNTLSGVYFSRITNYATTREMMLEATMTLYGRVPHTPEYKAVEDAWAAVNVGPPADRTPPSVVITTGQKSSTYAVVTVDVSDENGLVEGMVGISSGLIDGRTTLQPCTGHCVFTLDPSQYGTSSSHYVKVTAKDTRGNSVEKKVYFALDASGPTVTLTSNKPTTWSPIAPQQDWKYSATDTSGIRSAKVFVDGVAVVDESWSSSPVSSFTLNNVVVDVSNRAEGWYPVRFETSDRFGNTRENSYSLAVDHTAPEVCTQTVTVDPANNGNVYLTLTGRDAVSGLSNLAIHHTTGGLLRGDTTDVGPGVQRTLSHTATLAPGTYLFFGNCMDQSSNVVRTPYQTVTLVGSCNSMATAGGAQVDERTFQMGKAAGTVKLSYHTYSVHDRIKVYSGTTLVADTGCAATGDPSTLRTVTFAYSGTSGQLKVRVEPNCNPVTAQSTTEWVYSLSCP
ncbi:M4 family metallopeptidase [Pyxidicoccus sp. MSG2]|uniref:M4 family metallopeptidase n=1 Tax=Pyxidicoccus sp. MSG2 TaxID=2996790 RepID=UPI002270E278|nr:M4 family metallopeptidase [Pyxidicoccus sp. MSG2]MCY1020094.1 M4 family metallopeptidase [Pyxidicoccus sp. MSG2]